MKRDYKRLCMLFLDASPSRGLNNALIGEGCVFGVRKNALCKRCVNYYKGEGIAAAHFRGLEEGLRAAEKKLEQIADNMNNVWLPVTCWYCGNPIMNRLDGFKHKMGSGEEILVHHACHLKLHEKNREEDTEK